jgi:hypothetical protein
MGRYFLGVMSLARPASYSAPRSLVFARVTCGHASPHRLTPGDIHCCRHCAQGARAWYGESAGSLAGLGLVLVPIVPHKLLLLHSHSVTNKLNLPYRKESLYPTYCQNGLIWFVSNAVSENALRAVYAVPTATRPSVYTVKRNVEASLVKPSDHKANQRGKKLRCHQCDPPPAPTPEPRRSHPSPIAHRPPPVARRPHAPLLPLFPIFLSKYTPRHAPVSKVAQSSPAFPDPLDASMRLALPHGRLHPSSPSASSPPPSSCTLQIRPARFRTLTLVSSLATCLPT